MTDKVDAARGLLLVASDADPAVADILRQNAEGLLHVPFDSQHVPAPLPLTCRQIRQSGVDDACAMVGYLRDSAALRQIWENDKRVAVRCAVATNPRTDHRTRTEILTWLRTTERLRNLTMRELAAAFGQSDLDETAELLTSLELQGSNLSHHVVAAVARHDDIIAAVRQVAASPVLGPAAPALVEAGFEGELPLEDVITAMGAKRVQELLHSRKGRPRRLTVNDDSYPVVVRHRLVGAVLQFTDGGQGVVSPAVVRRMLDDMANGTIKIGVEHKAVVLTLAEGAGIQVETVAPALCQHLVSNPGTLRNCWGALDWDSRVKVLTDAARVTASSPGQNGYDWSVVIERAVGEYHDGLGKSVADAIAGVLHLTRGNYPGRRLPPLLLESVLANTDAPHPYRDRLRQTLYATISVADTPWEVLVKAVRFDPALLWELLERDANSGVVDGDLLDALHESDPTMSGYIRPSLIRPWSVPSGLLNAILQRPWGPAALNDCAGLIAVIGESQDLDAMKILWDLLHTALGDDQKVWCHAAALLNRWPHSINALAATARATAHT